MSAVDRVLEHVEGVQEKGNGFWALCPAHDDHNPSLHIQQSDDGSALIICRAGCDQGDVVDALERRGLKRSDLFASKQVASVVPFDGRSNASRSPSKGRERLVKNYHIKDEAGRLCGIHERWEDPETPDAKSFKWKLPNGRYSQGDISPAAMPLFGSELLADWPKNYRVVLCEGETPAAALRSRNIRAVGTVCGAKLIPDAPALEVLRGRPVVVWGDGDPLGQKHAERLVRALRGVAASVQLYEWTDPPEGVKGADAADHPAVRSGDREEIKALVRQLRDAPEANVDQDQVPALRDRVLLGKIMREGVEPPEELVQDVLLAGKVHSLYSAASTGKTFLMLWLVLRVLEQGLRVLIFDRENGHRIMAERLDALGADPEKVDELLYYSFYPELPTTEEGLLDYENTLDEVKPALVVFDSLIGFLAANGLDENSSNDVSTWATHYAHPARSRGTTVLLLDHVPKEGVSSRGSSRKRDEVDVMWALRNPLPFDRDTVGRIVIHREKDREGWLPDNIGFSVGGGEDGFVFARSLGTIEAKGDDGLTKFARITLEAVGSLEEKGATTAEWEKAASGMGVSRTSFYRAKRSEGVKSRIFLQNGRYYLKGATGAKQVPRDHMAPGATPARRKGSSTSNRGRKPFEVANDAADSPVSDPRPVHRSRGEGRAGDTRAAAAHRSAARKHQGAAWRADGLPERVGWRGMATGAGVRAPGGRAYLRARPRRSAGCRRGGVGGGGVNLYLPRSSPISTKKARTVTTDARCSKMRGRTCVCDRRRAIRVD